MAQWSNSSPLRQHQSTPEAAVTSLKKGGRVGSVSSSESVPLPCPPPLSLQPATVRVPTRNSPPRHHATRGPRVEIMANPLDQDSHQRRIINDFSLMRNHY